MKCIKDLQSGKIRRVKDDVGRALNRLPSHQLVPKWMYKDQEGIEYRGTRLPMENN